MSATDLRGVVFGVAKMQGIIGDSHFGRRMLGKASKAIALISIMIATTLAGCTDSAPAAVDQGDMGTPDGATDLDVEGVKGSGPGTGGGKVSDVPPTVTAFAGSLTTADNSGTSFEVFTGTLRDANGEGDFKGAVVTVALTGARTGSFSHTVTSQEANTLVDEPADYDANGFKAWTGTKHDGILNIKFRYSYLIGTAPGTYTFTPSVTPSGGTAIAGAVDTTLVEVFSEITISPDPVDGAGNAVQTNWGGWTAEPGSTGVASTNYLKLVNTGQKSDATVVIGFSDSQFRGADANFSIAINGNIAYDWVEVDSGVTPSAATFSTGSTSADGSVAVTFSALNKVIFVKYRVIELPEVLARQSYGAAFTATEL